MTDHVYDLRIKTPAGVTLYASRGWIASGDRQDFIGRWLELPAGSATPIDRVVELRLEPMTTASLPDAEELGAAALRNLAATAQNLVDAYRSYVKDPARAERVPAILRSAMADLEASSAIAAALDRDRWQDDYAPGELVSREIDDLTGACLECGATPDRGHVIGCSRMDVPR